MRAFLFFACAVLPLALFGIHPPKAFPVLEKEGYCLQYDSRGKVPAWTWEVLTSESLSVNVRRKKDPFCPEKEVLKVSRAELKDYRGSGFDRGHMVPAGDLRYSKEALDGSFSLANICPPNSNMNRNFWRELESHVRDHIRKREWEKVSVSTGPLFLPEKGEDGERYVRYQVIGKNNVAVPTHIFKLVFAEKGPKSQTWCYVVPNREIPKEDSFEKYEVSLGELEKLSGLDFSS